MPRRQEDPFADYNFLVEIDGVPRAGFAEVSGLSTTTDVIEYRNGNETANAVRKLPGLTKYANVVLKRGITRDQVLWDWRKTVIDGQINRLAVQIALLDEARQTVVRFILREAWPVKYEGPNLSARGNEVAIETLEIAHERMDVEFD